MRTLAAPLALAAVVLVLAACGSVGRTAEGESSRGKQLFTENCGSCHTLADAGTRGRVGPNLDEAFANLRSDQPGQGFKESTIRDVVRGQIAYPVENPPTGKPGMPANLVTGDDARDVAAYVAEVAGQPGEDRGALAQAGLAGAKSGRQIFVAAGCGSCHKLSAAGTSGNVGPGLDDLAASAGKLGKQRGESAEEYIRESIIEPDAFTVPGFRKGVMPGNYGERLKPEQIKALVDYLMRGGKG